MDPLHEPDAGQELLRLALSRPTEALARARLLAADAVDPCAISFARQAIGIVLRDRGETAAAVTELRRAVRAAGACGRADRVADVRATLGAALVMHGRSAAGLRELDAAAAGAHGITLATVAMRRAHVLALLGRHADALDDMRRALAGIRRTGDVVWEARCLNNRGDILVAMGEAGRAERDVRRAGELFAAAGQELEAAHAVHNLGLIAACVGDVPATFRLFDEAADRYAALGVSPPALAVDRCLAHLAVGMADEAVQAVRAALAAGPVQPRHRAELLLMLATATLAHGDADEALATAAAAARLFRAQRRDVWQARARLVAVRAEAAAVRAEVASGPVDPALVRPALVRPTLVRPALVRQALDLAGQLQRSHAEEASSALLLAGRLAGAQGHPGAGPALAAAARYRRHPSGPVRATAWLARALAEQAAGDRRGVLLACGRGLDALVEHRIALGASEVRALSARHGAELAELALREVAAGGRARELLRWSERVRATALAPQRVRPPRDVELAAHLAALRRVAGHLEEARGRGAPTAALDAERVRLERWIRARRLHAQGAGEGTSRVPLDGLLAELAASATTLLELVVVDGLLIGVVAAGGRVRRIDVGGLDPALRAAQLGRFALRQAARRRPTDLAAMGQRMQEALLGPAVGALGEGPLVIAPPARLHDVPWGMLPCLAGRPVGTTPSAAVWLRARRSAAAQGARTVLVAGPGLASGGAEVAALAARAGPGDTRVLTGRAATVRAALDALDGAGLVHIAAHGHYRRDNPMFSSLLLDDGPLTVHDFEALDRSPHRVVLSACDSGLLAAVAADEVVGLAAALLWLGSAGVVCSVAEVNDEQTVPLMIGLHERLESGAGMAQVLLEARLAARGDPLAEATAAAFVALGA